MHTNGRSTFSSRRTTSQNAVVSRLQWLEFLFLGAFVAIIFRLGYWQIWKHNELASAAVDQYESSYRIASQRGPVTDSLGRILVGNKEQYTLFAQPQVIQEEPENLAQRLTPIILQSIEKTPLEATDSAWIKQKSESIFQQLKTSLDAQDKQWIALAHNLSREQRQVIEDFDVHGLGFDTHYVRSYPDASLSAQLLGFVGKTDLGEDQGYFGLEGYYDLELRGRGGVIHQQQTALGLPILFGKREVFTEEEGSTLKLTINRDLQAAIEKKLLSALERYGAVSGEVIVMDPQTGAILAMASFPNYDPSTFMRFPAQYYRNPAVSDLYEPGSTMKVVTVAAAIEKGAITPDTQCTDCAGPRVISGFTIRTWNEQYNPDINMKDALAKSDNTAMVFAQERMGKDPFLEMLRKFGFHEKTGIDVQGEAEFPFRESKDWRTIDVATASFGQGLATTSIQLVRAVAAIANGGKLLRPYVVQTVKQGEKEIQTQPKVIREVISPQTAKTVTDMMVYTASQGDAKWALPEGVTVAGKTGTAQIAGEGGYLADKTIASFVGFAPADNPKFVMLVKLREPTSSPWGSETAAPLWFEILPDLLK